MAKYHAEPLKAAGKGLIALGNIGAALLFVQSYWEMSRLSGPVMSIVWLIGCYSIGMMLVGIGHKRQSQELQKE